LWRETLVIGEWRIGCVLGTLIYCYETAPAIDRRGRTLPDVHHLTMTVMTILSSQMRIMKMMGSKNIIILGFLGAMCKCEARHVAFGTGQIWYKMVEISISQMYTERREVSSVPDFHIPSLNRNIPPFHAILTPKMKS
jgi:hypothetical protein